MRTMIDTVKRLRFLVLLISIVSLLALVGCGNSKEAPFGATMTITEIIKSSGTPTTGTTEATTYRVSVVDAAGLPMANIDVDLLGGFTSGDRINMNGSIGSVGLSPLVLASKITLNNSGYQDFTVSAPTITARPIFPPALGSGSGISGGGSLINGTYNYAVTALDVVGGETNAAGVFSVVLSDGTSTQGVHITWPATVGAAGYNVYGRTGATPGVLSLLASNITGTTGYNDSGAAAIGGAPPASNTTGVAVNTVTGSIQATSGSLIETTDVSMP